MAILAGIDLLARRAAEGPGMDRPYGQVVKSGEENICGYDIIAIGLLDNLESRGLAGKYSSSGQ